MISEHNFYEIEDGPIDGYVDMMKKGDTFTVYVTGRSTRCTEIMIWKKRIHCMHTVTVLDRPDADHMTLLVTDNVTKLPVVKVLERQ